MIKTKVSKLCIIVLLAICTQILVIGSVHAEAPQIVSFSATPNVVAPDGQVTLTWETRGFRYARLSWTKFDENYGEHIDQDVSTSGSLTLPAKDIELFNQNEFYLFFNLWASNEPFPTSGGQTRGLSVKVNVNLAIQFFTITPDNVSSFETLTFAWSAPGADYVTLSLPIWPYPSSPEFGKLPATGTLTYTVRPEDLTHTSLGINMVSKIPPFRSWWQVFLTAYSPVRPDARLTQMVPVTLRCGMSGPFWGKTSDCPSSKEISTSASMQMFEGGSMLWSKDTHQILVLYNNGNWQRFEDTWKESDLISASDTPPVDRILPVRGFGKVWVNNSKVRQQLGWATGAEKYYGMRHQDYRGCTVYSLLDHHVVFLNQKAKSWASDATVCDTR